MAKIIIWTTLALGIAPGVAILAVSIFLYVFPIGKTLKSSSSETLTVHYLKGETYFVSSMIGDFDMARRRRLWPILLLLVGLICYVSGMLVLLPKSH